MAYCKGKLLMIKGVPLYNYRKWRFGGMYALYELSARRTWDVQDLRLIERCRGPMNDMRQPALIPNVQKSLQ
jgi:hypothetical protein